jgi:N-acylneuraminate cytidylyltransferase/CMP-N,N'-diacetyllegionaminic acid synthase
MLALITARGGSKSIPGKNIKLLAGKPLIAWSIEAAQQASSIDRIIVSTDDEGIAKVALAWGAEVPFFRPSELAQDNSPSIDAILHAIRWLDEHENYRPEYVLLLQPTSPLRSAEDIQNAYQMAQNVQAEALVSVTPVDKHPYWMKTISTDGRLADFMSADAAYTRRQDLPPVYALNGAIYLARRELLLARSSFFVENTLAYIMPPERSLDIDTPWELYMTEVILEARKQHESH